VVNDDPGVRSAPADGSLEGRSVLVTGADGFIGSHVVERLLREGAEVAALCLYTSGGGHGWLDELTPEQRDRVDIHLGDIRDGGFVRDLVADRELVMHLAALIAIPYSYLAPRSFIETNVLGTQNVLDAVRAAGTRMINTSTSEVYGTPDEVPIRETHPLKAQSPYAASKIAADKLCESYARSFETEVTTLRPFNTYGPRQSLRAVIPTVLAQLLAGADTIHLGSLTPRRDFTFVADTVDGFIRMATVRPEPGAVIQLGTGSSVSIAQLVDVCQAILGTDAAITSDEDRIRPAGSEVETLVSDPATAAARLGWKATVTLEDGLRRTAAWVEQRGPAADVANRYHR
jgi:NAD dependent epimerase/dehydratase